MSTQTYSIAGRNGSGRDGAAYPTIAAAVAAANPGTLIYVRGGTYQELATVAPSRQSCFWLDKAITLEAYPGEAPTLTYGTVPTYDTVDTGAIVYVSAANVILRGLLIIGTHAEGDSPGGGDLDCNVLIQNGASVILDRCTLTGFGHCGAKGNDIVATDCTVGDGGFTFRDHAFYCASPGTVRISRVTMSNCAGYGLHLYGTPDGVVIEDCIITDNDNGGILCGGNGGHTIRRNTITGNAGYGGFVLWKQQSVGNLITDNVITGNGGEADVVLDDAVAPQTISGNTVGTFWTNTDDAAWPH